MVKAEPKNLSPIEQLNMIMKNMDKMAEINNNPQKGQGGNNMQNQFATNMNTNPMMNQQYMTGMNMGGMGGPMGGMGNMGGMGGMGNMGMGGMGMPG